MTRGQRAGFKCGYPVKVCDNCDKTVAPSRLRLGKSCPKCPDGTGVHDGSCQNPVKDPGGACHAPGHDGTLPGPRPPKSAPKDDQAAKALERAKGVLSGLGGGGVLGGADDPALATTDPITNLEYIGAVTMQLVRNMEKQVGELREIRYSSPVIGTEQIRGELTYFLQSINAAMTIQANIFKLNLDERRVQVDEARAIAMVACVNAALAKADIPEVNRGRVVEALSAELKALEPGNPLRPKDRRAD